MADSKPKSITVEALKAHTYNGKDYQVGDTYDFIPHDNPSGISADQQVDSLLQTGFAVRVDRAAVAKAQVKAAEQAQKARAKGAVSPMTTDAALTPKRSVRGGVRKARASKKR